MRIHPLALVLAASLPCLAKPPAADTSLGRLALDQMHAVVTHDHALPRLHAAEDLVLLGEKDPLAPIAGELPGLATQPIYRIVLWRVQARQAAAAGESMEPFFRRISAVFFAMPAAPDQVNAAETLGKLGYSPHGAEREGFLRFARQDSLVGLHARWVAAGGGDGADEKALAAFLGDANPDLRGDAAYALRFRPHVRKTTRELLIAGARKEPAGSGARSYLYASALFHAGADERPELLAEVRRIVKTGTPDDIYEVMNVLALVGGPEEIPLLRPFLQPMGAYEEKDADLRVASGYAILSILGRTLAGH